MQALAMLILVLGGITLFGIEVYRRLRLVTIGRPEVRWNHVGKRLGRVVSVVLGQRKLLQRPLRGSMHFVFFWGFLILQTVSLQVIGEGILGHDFRLPLIGGTPVLGLLQELTSALVLVAIGVALYNRYLRGNPHIKAHSDFDALFILIGIAGLMITFFLTNGWLLSLGQQLPRQVMPISGATADWLSGLTPATRAWIGTVSFWLHAATLVALLVWIPRGKHFHLVTAPPNVFFNGSATHHPGTALSPLHIDLEAMDEDAVLGASKLEELTWKQLYDTYSCTECGRCQDQCPAFLTDKDLTPKGLQVELRRHLETAGPAVLAGQTDDGPAARSLVPDVFSDNFIWSCTTCRACVHECPVDIEHIDTIIEMRRYKAMIESDFPAEAVQLFKNLEQRGNPWGVATDRLAWAEGLDIPVLGDDAGEYEILYWVGCAGAFDPNGQRVSRAMVEIFHAAGVKFAVLGDAETCNGDPARRLGYEYLFQMLVEQNIETLNSRKVRRIVTQCPHCFSTMKNEFPQFGGHYEVTHHSEYIAELIASGRLQLAPGERKTITFHDSCYLGRHNHVYDPPRRVIEAAGGQPVMEMPRHRERGFCCGAGGGRMWLEETVGTRVNLNRIDEALELNPQVIALACPFCHAMLGDGLKARDRDEEVEALDIAELVIRALPQRNG